MKIKIVVRNFSSDKQRVQIRAKLQHQEQQNYKIQIKIDGTISRVINILGKTELFCRIQKNTRKYHNEQN